MPQLRPEDLAADERDALGRVNRRESVEDRLRQSLQSRGLIEPAGGGWVLTNDGSVLLATIGLQKLDE